MRVRVEFWGPARDLVGVEMLDLDFARSDRVTVADLRERITALHPRLAAGGRSVRWAVNDEFVAEHRAIRDGDVVAVIPPVSGG